MCSNGWQIAQIRRVVASSAGEDVFAAGCVGSGGPPRRPCGVGRCASTDEARVRTRTPAAASTRMVRESGRIGADYTGAGNQGGESWLDSHGGKRAPQA